MPSPPRTIVLGMYRTPHDEKLLAAALDLGIRQVDTAYNYAGFASHRMLSHVLNMVGSEDIKITTKLGYFAHAGRNRHSLDPKELRRALEVSAADLRMRPYAVLLHNPEETLSRLPRSAAVEVLSAALSELRDGTQRGVADHFGIASWAPDGLADLLKELPSALWPEISMVRAGFLASRRDLAASLRLFDLTRLPEQARWGMSPFGGRNPEETFGRLNTRPFSSTGLLSVTALALRAAFDLPPVSHLAVSSSSREHLKELLEAAASTVDERALSRYRERLLSDSPRS